jgi:hypothetical protein
MAMYPIRSNQVLKVVINQSIVGYNIFCLPHSKDERWYIERKFKMFHCPIIGTFLTLLELWAVQ